MPDEPREETYIGYLAIVLSVGIRRAHQLAKQYAWPFRLDEHGYRLYDVRQAVRLTPNEFERAMIANRARSACVKAQHAARKSDNDMAITAAAEADDWRRT